MGTVKEKDNGHTMLGKVVVVAAEKEPLIGPDVLRRRKAQLRVPRDQRVRQRPKCGVVLSDRNHRVRWVVERLRDRALVQHDLDETRRLIAVALEHDVVLTSGGVSVGEFDFVAAINFNEVDVVRVPRRMAMRWMVDEHGEVLPEYRGTYELRGSRPLDDDQRARLVEIANQDDRAVIAP